MEHHMMLLNGVIHFYQLMGVSILHTLALSPNPIIKMLILTNTCDMAL